MIAMSAAALLVVTLAVPAGVQAARDGGTQSQTYLVELAGVPLASYEGGVSGIPATKPDEGERLDSDTWNYRAYREHLRARRDAVTDKAGLGKKVVADYDTVFNGFAATLTAQQAAKLDDTPGVVQVWRNEIVRAQSAPQPAAAQPASAPAALGLDGTDGVWAKEFGGRAHAGEGVIVGVIDSGIWPENPSFAPLPEPRPDQALIDAKWSGRCDVGTEAPVVCSNKIIGARYYRNDPEVPDYEGEFTSPRDLYGHGTHVAGTAAGNADVPVTVGGVELGKVSGVAPAARIAVYKTMWRMNAAGDMGAGTVDLIAAIDDAVADGVDVINYSMTAAPGLNLPIQRAFFEAAAAGVYVAAVAGNGNGLSSVMHAAPWTTSTAAASYGLASRAVTLGNGKSYDGDGFGPALPSAGLVDAATAAASGKTAAEAELCLAGSLDPEKAAGRIVFCATGKSDAISKSEAVKSAGGVGMILFDKKNNLVSLDGYAVPTVHIGTTEAPEIKAYLAEAGAAATAAFGQSRVDAGRAPEIIATSGEGPARIGGGDLLKPDVAAPGGNIVAAVSPAGHPARQDFDMYAGSSMAAPHVAGIAALLRGKHPSWSPLAIKSAIMTSATTLDNEGKPIQRFGADADPHDFGNGHVRPRNAFDPGLVYDSSPQDWLGYTCAVGYPFVTEGENGQQVNFCDTVKAIDPSDLNMASIAIGDLAGTQTVTRTVTNVTGKSSTYLARVEAPPGIAVSVAPQTFTIKPGKSATFKVTFTRTTAEYGKTAFGALVLTDLRGHNVRSAIAVRPEVLAGAPDAVTWNGVSGSATVPLRSGFTGVLTTTPRGLAEGTVHPLRLTGTGRFDTASPAESDAVKKVDFAIGEGSFGAVATYGADMSAGTDIDLFVYSGGKLIGQSDGGTASESLMLQPGAYTAYLVQYAAPGSQQTDVPLNTFEVSDGGGLVADPASRPVAMGAAAPVTVLWKGLVPGRHYLGSLTFGDVKTELGATLVWVNT
ncbi:S8 family serine peptidase [Actinoplanes sp. NPDC049118]|uniref:S8 family serine peptidase n=1 Tax=Actinoplanes sp. NPDC049118 TaxID=3155769 RepID=UPI0033C98542